MPPCLQLPYSLAPEKVGNQKICHGAKVATHDSLNTKIEMHTKIEFSLLKIVISVTKGLKKILNYQNLIAQNPPQFLRYPPNSWHVTLIPMQVQLLNYNKGLETSSSLFPTGGSNTPVTNRVILRLDYCLTVQAGAELCQTQLKLGLEFTWVRSGASNWYTKVLPATNAQLGQWCSGVCKVQR